MVADIAFNPGIVGYQQSRNDNTDTRGQDATLANQTARQDFLRQENLDNVDQQQIIDRIDISDEAILRLEEQRLQEQRLGEQLEIDRVVERRLEEQRESSNFNERVNGFDIIQPFTPFSV